MHIDRKLNVVIPIERDESTLYIHMTPLRYEIFERYYLIIAKTFNALYAEGLREMGARIAYLMLMDTAKASGKAEEVEIGLIGELMRTSNALILNDAGWVTMSVDSAYKGGLLTEDEMREFKGYAVFFSCVWSMHTKLMATASVEIMANLWGLLTTSLDCMEYKTSLQTLMKNENIEKQTTLSVTS